MPKTSHATQLNKRDAALFATGAQLSAPADGNPTKVTVEVEGNTYVPSWLEDRHGNTKPYLVPLIRALAAVGVTGFDAWFELTKPHPALHGAILKEVAASDLSTALSAIIRHYS